MARHEPWGRPEIVASGDPCWSGTMLELQEQVPPSVAKQINQPVEEKQNTPFAWKLTPESRQSPGEQTINSHVSNLVAEGASRSPGPSNTSSPQDSEDPAGMAHVFREAAFEPNKQPKAWPAGLRGDCPQTVYPATMCLSSQSSLTSNQDREEKLSFQGLGAHKQESLEPTVAKQKIPGRKHKIFVPNEEKEAFMSSEAGSQGESFGRVRPSQTWALNTSAQLRDTVTTETKSSLSKLWKGTALTKIFLKEIVRSVLRCLNLSKRDQGKEDSLKDGRHSSRPPPATVQTQMSVTTQNLANMLTEAHSLLNIVMQILVDRLGLQVGDPTVKWQKVEPYTSQVGSSPLAHDGHCDPEGNRLRRRMSCGPHSSPKGYNHPFMYRGIREKRQSGAAAQRVCDRHQCRMKREMVCGHLPRPKANNHAFMYRKLGEKQQSGTRDQRACDPHQIRMKSEMECGPQRNPKRSNHPFMYRRIGDKHQWQSDIAAEKACDPNQSMKKGMDYDSLASPQENNHSCLKKPETKGNQG
uniref:Uncharacterized protein n=2 Tax=Nannospalax galili TaxID=1026970 RepID=A0A8C6QQJ8_NANGA